MRRLVEVFRAAGVRFSQDGCAFFAQAIAFNALFAVFPILILTVAVMGFIYGTVDGKAHALALIDTLAPSVQPILTDNLRHVVAFRGISGTIALVALVWSGKNLFQTLAYALDRALGIPQGRPLVKDILTSVVILPVLGLLLLVATAIPLVISFVVEYGAFRHAVVLTQVAGYGTAVVLIFVVAVLLYDFLPNRRVRLGFGVPGAFVTTAAYELAQIAFAIYSTHVDFRHVYGALAAVAILLIWFYYMGYIFLFGAEFSAQWLAQRERTQEKGDSLETRRSA
ncbi:MAG: YihY/virulence factor BrkB family protein [Vulcanimicrobiaceae bacterium]